MLELQARQLTAAGGVLILDALVQVSIARVEDECPASPLLGTTLRCHACGSARRNAEVIPAGLAAAEGEGSSMARVALRSAGGQGRRVWSWALFGLWTLAC